MCVSVCRCVRVNTHAVHK